MAVLAAEDDDSFSFCPSSDKLVDRYLRAKLDSVFGGLANAAYFLDADVCSARPQDLVRAHRKPARVSTRGASDGQQFYFFSPVRFLGSSQKKKARTIAGNNGKESWHAEGSPKPVEGSAAGGFVQRFSYHVRVGEKIVEKPGWIMLEYSFKDEDTVLCKVYKSPRGPGGSMKSAGSKRKATDDLEAAASIPSTRRRQTSQEDADAILFAGEERDILPVEYQAAAAPEFTEAQNTEESQPEMVPASFDSNTILSELENYFKMAEEDDDGTALQVPDGVIPEAYELGLLLGSNQQQDAAVQTVHAPPLHDDYNVIANLGAGFTLEDMFGPSCPQSGGGACSHLIRRPGTNAFLHQA